MEELQSDKVAEAQSLGDPAQAREWQIVAMLKAEYDYWARLDEGASAQMASASMIAMGALSNVLAGILLGLSPAEYIQRIETQRRIP